MILRTHRFGFLWLAALLIGVIPAAAQDSPTPVPAQTNVLVWWESGASPQESSPSTAGELGLLDASGAFMKLLDVPPQTSRVQACGDEAVSPDGALYAFYIGLDSGTLYLMRGSDTPQALDTVSALTCLGGGTLQYSPDSSRIAYIVYEPDAVTSEFPDGFLHIASAANLDQQFVYDNVTAFDLTNDGAAFVSFFTNDRNEADEAAVFWWDGRSEREVVTLRPDANCRYTSASIAVAPDGSLLLVMGHRCASGDTRTSWQFYRVDTQRRSATLAASEFQDGQFAAFARTNRLWVLPGGQFALFTIPDGVTANTTGLRVVELASLALTEVIQRQAVMPTLSGAPNAAPLVSPDGRWLALVVTSPNNDNTLQVIDLTDPGAPPIRISAGSRNDVISSLHFTPDSRQLIFIAGSAGAGRSADNALAALDLTTGSDYRIKRGRFAPGLAIAPDSRAVVVMDYQILRDERQPAYLNLVQIDLQSGETTVLFEGADIVDGAVTNPRFALPLSWRP